MTEALCPPRLGPAVRGALAGGVSIVQLREKDMPERRSLELARRVGVWTRETGALFMRMTGPTSRWPPTPTASTLGRTSYP